MILGITGTIASGKGRAASYLKEKGFIHHSLSSEIRQIAKERSIEINRNNLIELGNLLRLESLAESILASRVLTNINIDLKNNPKANFVIDGFRDPDEINTVRHHEFEPNKQFILIAIDAFPKIRFQRLKKRNRNGDPKTYEEFIALDKSEKNNGGGQELNKCFKMADYLIRNNKDINTFNSYLNKILEEIN
ncbi:AAA family ATPase [Candidatus Woesearchaeota archaeon]|jgi:dephospho-CoA kinase|nr:AAA family ATPase [Candidatus Woesearchaeota archaeon]MBT6519224.1 AAA family ATPase [Candidatus Woesearchaeota archaeon]MBT7367505.1 AAA family ATPase [Candidatus Woesearchaeota archaeon]